MNTIERLLLKPGPRIDDRKGVNGVPSGDRYALCPLCGGAVWSWWRHAVSRLPRQWRKRLPA